MGAKLLNVYIQTSRLKHFSHGNIVCSFDNSVNIYLSICSFDVG